MNETYQPGLHSLLRLHSPTASLLQDMQAWQAFVIHLLTQNQLEIVGMVSHQFDTDGFTVAVCLKESHICIHTWPEFGCLTLDVYLCNYQKNNNDLVRSLVSKNIEYFHADILQQNEISR